MKMKENNNKIPEELLPLWIYILEEVYRQGIERHKQFNRLLGVSLKTSETQPNQSVCDKHTRRRHKNTASKQEV